MIRFPDVEMPPLRIVPPEMIIEPPVAELSLKIVPSLITNVLPVGVPPILKPPLFIVPPSMTIVLPD